MQAQLEVSINFNQLKSWIEMLPVKQKNALLEQLWEENAYVIPGWQKTIVKNRLKNLKANPSSGKSWNQIMKELE